MDIYELWIDGSQEQTSVALSRNRITIGVYHGEVPKSHTADIPVETMAMVRSAGISVSDLSNIYVCKGPGSYTGLRVSYAWAMGLADPFGIPCYEIPIYELLAQKAATERAFILFHARRTDYRVWAQNHKSDWIETAVAEPDLAAFLDQSDAERFLTIADISIDLPYVMHAVHAASMMECLDFGLRPKPLTEPLYFNPPYITQRKKALI